MRGELDLEKAMDLLYGRLPDDDDDDDDVHQIPTYAGNSWPNYCVSLGASVKELPSWKVHLIPLVGFTM